MIQSRNNKAIDIIQELFLESDTEQIVEIIAVAILEVVKNANTIEEWERFSESISYLEEGFTDIIKLVSKELDNIEDNTYTNIN